MLRKHHHDVCCPPFESVLNQERQICLVVHSEMINKYDLNDCIASTYMIGMPSYFAIVIPDFKNIMRKMHLHKCTFCTFSINS